MTYLLHQVLRRTAEAHPERTAVVWGEQRLTYRELDATTDRLAATLRANGVHRGDRVGIYLNKSADSIVAAHGVLKAGGAYVPFDPNAPAARISYIAKNAGIRCVVGSTRKAAEMVRTGAGHGSVEIVVLLDSREEPPGAAPFHVVPWESVRANADPPPAIEGIETDLAYILYTSGSTGEPKGVMISHRNALTFVDWACATFALGPEDRVSSHAPLHFDLSIFDIFASAKAGAAVFPVPEEYSIFPRRLVKFIRENSISVWYSVPSILTHMLIHGGLADSSFPDVRVLLFAGEVFPAKYLRVLMGLLPQADLFNLYGPTETNVCTYYPVTSLEPDRIKPIPIGRACDDIEVFILDAEGRPVTSAGVEGELCVRGPCVAQGYWADQAKTAQSFVRNHLCPEYEDRMYRTGDLVTRDTDGNYHLVGRRDHMIKSRGYRIELGEIEAALYGHAEVKEAAVVAVPDELITNRIKAFVVPMKPGGLEKIALDQHLAARIPHYMIPEAIEFRSELPKTSTGKVDRKALAQMKSEPTTAAGTTT